MQDREPRERVGAPEDARGSHPERRTYPRRETRLPARIRISLHFTDLSARIRQSSRQIYGLVDTLNISSRGFMVRVVGTAFETRGSLTPSLVRGLVGKAVVVELEDQLLTLWADIIRVEPGTMEIGLHINRVSDEQAWLALCEGTAPEAR